MVLISEYLTFKILFLCETFHLLFINVCESVIIENVIRKKQMMKGEKK